MTSTKIWLLMRNEVNNKQESHFFILTYKTTQCVGFLTQTYKRKHNTEGPFVWKNRQKVRINILVQKICLGWKLSPITNRQGG